LVKYKQLHKDFFSIKNITNKNIPFKNDNSLDVVYRIHIANKQQPEDSVKLLCKHESYVTTDTQNILNVTLSGENSAYGAANSVFPRSASSIIFIFYLFFSNCAGSKCFLRMLICDKKVQALIRCCAEHVVSDH